MGEELGETHLTMVAGRTPIPFLPEVTAFALTLHATPHELVEIAPEHFHTRGAHDLAAAGETMLAAAGSAIYEFYDLT